MNCHGEVIPAEGTNHDGGEIGPGESCTSSGCHTQANNTNATNKDDWKVPGQESWFKGKDAKALCEQMADWVANHGRQDFMDHLQSDFQIDLGFEGRSGGANDDPAGAPPPMTKPNFLVAAARWMDDGFAACDREGTIVHSESISSQETKRISPNHVEVYEQTGQRTVTIRLANGQYQAEVEVKGQTMITQTIKMETNGGECTTVITTFGDYEDAAPIRSGGPLGNVSTDAGVTVALLPDGSYTMMVALGAEKHRQFNHATVQDGCGTGVKASPPETVEREWRPTRFMIRGKLVNPRDRSLLVGRDLRMVFKRVSRDEDPWLYNHYAFATLDGGLHPVAVKTAWNLKYQR
jgi:hypothetical protein